MTFSFRMNCPFKYHFKHTVRPIVCIRIISVLKKVIFTVRNFDKIYAFFHLYNFLYGNFKIP